MCSPQVSSVPLKYFEECGGGIYNNFFLVWWHDSHLILDAQNLLVLTMGYFNVATLTWLEIVVIFTPAVISVILWSLELSTPSKLVGTPLLQKQ
jgi:hypothetical protein